MTDKQIGSGEARTNFRDLLDDAQHGYHTAILRYGKEIAVLVPADWYEEAETAWSAQVEKDAGSS